MPERVERKTRRRSRTSAPPPWTSRLIAASPDTLEWADRVRRVGLLAPVLVAAYCLFVKGCALDGRAGLYYTFQRVVAECLLAMRLLEIRMAGRTG